MSTNEFLYSISIIYLEKLLHVQKCRGREEIGLKIKAIPDPWFFTDVSIMLVMRQRHHVGCKQEPLDQLITGIQSTFSSRNGDGGVWGGPEPTFFFFLPIPNLEILQNGSKTNDLIAVIISRKLEKNRIILFHWIILDTITPMIGFILMNGPVISRKQDLPLLRLKKKKSCTREEDS